MHTLFTIACFGLCALLGIADATTTTTTSISIPTYSNYIGLGTFDSTSVNAYGVFTCEAGTVYSTSGLWGCDTDKTHYPATSCGGKGPATLYYPSSQSSTCEKSEICHTNILYNDKKKKSPLTQYQCTSSSVKSSTWTFYRSDPPALKDGKSHAPGRMVDHAFYLGIVGGIFTLVMAVML